MALRVLINFLYILGYRLITWTAEETAECLSLIKILVSNRHEADIGPLICVSYTNNTLDQLLNSVIDSGVTSEVVRIGSQSKSERLTSTKDGTIGGK